MWLPRPGTFAYLAVHDSDYQYTPPAVAAVTVGFFGVVPLVALQKSTRRLLLDMKISRLLEPDDTMLELGHNGCISKAEMTSVIEHHSGMIFELDQRHGTHGTGRLTYTEERQESIRNRFPNWVSQPSPAFVEVITPEPYSPIHVGPRLHRSTSTEELQPSAEADQHM